MEFLDEKTYVDQAEKVIETLVKTKTDKDGNPITLVTTSKMRTILSMAADIYDSVSVQNAPVLDADTISRIEYLRVRMIYEAGREPKSVKPFIEIAKLLDYVKAIGDDKKRYILFYHYLEALVAFRKYMGKWDD